MVQHNVSAILFGYGVLQICTKYNLFPTSFVNALLTCTTEITWHRRGRFDLSTHSQLTHWGRDKMVADGIFKCIILNENVCISLKISLRFVPKVRINNIPALVQIMARRLVNQATSHYLNQWCLVYLKAWSYWKLKTSLMCNAWKCGINLWTTMCQPTLLPCLDTTVHCRTFKPEATNFYMYIRFVLPMPVMPWDN